VGIVYRFAVMPVAGQQGRALCHVRLLGAVPAGLPCLLGAALLLLGGGQARAAAGVRECVESPTYSISLETKAPPVATATAAAATSATPALAVETTPEDAGPAPAASAADGDSSDELEAQVLEAAAEARLLLVLDQIPSGPRCGVPGAACYPDETPQRLELESLTRVLTAVPLPGLAAPVSLPLALLGDGHGPASAPGRRLDRPPRA
jgi:hypothetical protein